MKEELDGFKEKMKEEMEKDAARIEEAIRADEEISKMKASAELRDKVKERIEAYQREELLSKLSEEDREALRLGRELQKKKAGAEPDVEIAGEIGITAEDVKKAPVRKGKIVWKRVAVLAAAVIAVFAIGITSVGGPERFIEKMKQTVGGREMTQVDSDNDYVANGGEEKEEAAYQQVKDEYGFDPVKIMVKPQKMVFDGWRWIRISRLPNLFMIWTVR